MSFSKALLSSGVPVLMEPSSNLRSASIGFWVRAGSTDEPKSIMGISHLIEHLLFKGTKKRGAKEISDRFESLGAEVNAFTSKEHTCYYARVMDENLLEVIDLFSEMLHEPAFRPEDIASEKEVVLEEIHHYEDAPDELIHDIFAETLWDGHPYGQSILGSKETVSSLGKEDIEGYFREHYSFEKALITVAGSFNQKKLPSSLDDRFKLSAARPKAIITPKLKVDGGLKVVEKDTEQAHICLGFEGLKGGDSDRFALNILDGILGGGMSSRLFQKIREERGLAYAVYSYHSFYKSSGSFVVYVGTRPSNLNEVVSLIDDEIASILKCGVDDQELQRVKSQMKGRLVLSMESTSSRMSSLGRSHLVHGEVLSIDELIAKVDAVEASDINRVCSRVFDPSKRTLTLIGPIDRKKLTA